MKYKPALDHLRGKAEELAGEASLAWSEVPQGTFRPDLAKVAVDRFMRELELALTSAYLEGALALAHAPTHGDVVRIFRNSTPEQRADRLKRAMVNQRWPGDGDDDIWDSLRQAAEARWADSTD